MKPSLREVGLLLLVQACGLALGVGVDSTFTTNGTWLLAAGIVGVETGTVWFARLALWSTLWLAPWAALAWWDLDPRLPEPVAFLVFASLLSALPSYVLTRFALRALARAAARAREDNNP